MSACQQIKVKTIPHTHTSGDITDFTPAVSAIVDSMIDSGAEEPVFATWAHTFSANYESTYHTVSANSACWTRACTATWLSAETDPVFTSWLQSNSAHESSVYNTVYANSAITWNYQGIDIKSLTANWESTYSTVGANSAVVWNYQGTDIKVLTGNWETIKTTVQNNSALWILSGISVETDPIFVAWAIANSGSFITLADGDTRYVNVTGDVMTGSLSAPILSTGTLYVGASTIYFIDGAGNAVNSLKSSDVDKFNANYTVVATHSANWDAAFLYSTIFSNNSAIYNNINTILNSNSANWQSVYNTVNSNSAVIWNYQGNDIKALTADWENIKTTVQVNSSLWILSGGSGAETLFTSWATANSANYQSTYTTVQTYSSTWGSGGTPVNLGDLVINGDTLSSTTQTVHILAAGNGRAELKVEDGGVSNFLWVQNDGIGFQTNDTNSNHYLWSFGLNGYTYFPDNNNGYSAFVNPSGGAYFSSVSTLSGNSDQWNTSYSYYINQSAYNTSVYNTVNANSAVVWNYQGTDIKALTADWELVRTTVQSNSAIWVLSGLSVETDPVFTSWAQTNSANYQTIYNTVISNSAQWAIDTGNTAVNTSVQTNSANWILAYLYATVYSINSASYTSTYNTVNTNSASWAAAETDPIFTAWQTANGPILSSINSTVNANSAVVWNYQGTDIKALTANWQTTYDNVNSNNANWSTAYTYSLVYASNSALYTSVYNTVNANSSVVWNYQGTDIKVLSSKWENASTVVQNISDNWNTSYTYSTVYSNNSALYASVYSTVNTNSATWNAYASGGNSEVNSYVFSNSATNNLIIATVQTNSAQWAGNTLDEIWIGAGAMLPSNLSGASAVTMPITAGGFQIYMDTYDFDAASIQYTQFDIGLPANGNKQAIKAKFYWTNGTSATAGDVVWSIQAASISDGGTIDSAWGAVQEVTDTLSNNGKLQITNATNYITPSGTTGNDGLLLFRVSRNASSALDTMAVNARLAGIKLQYTFQEALTSAW